MSLLAAIAPGVSTVPPAPPEPASLAMTAAEMFRVAEQAELNYNFEAAEVVYRALVSDPSLAIRSEARFRLAGLLVRQGRLVQGATILRQILDEQPEAQRVRVELATILAMVGDESAARRELRLAQSGGLPPEVALLLDRFSAALRSRRPFGGSVQVALASDTNINRATRSDTLGTVIGDFILDDNAKARSGHGIALDGQSFVRVPMGRDSLLMSVWGSADLYSKRRFHDVALGGKVGPELSVRGNRLNLGASSKRRWLAGIPYTTTIGLQADLARPLTRTVQLRAAAAADQVHNHRNSLEAGRRLAGSMAFEAALSASGGAGLALAASRNALRDPGYSNSAFQVAVFGYRQLGRSTITASASIGRLVADERLPLYPNRREEWSVRGTFGATLRQFTVQAFAPTVEFMIERNHSSIEIYDFRRTALEFGVARAF